MPELPRISGDEAIKVFKRLGFYEADGKKGDGGKYITSSHFELIMI